MTVAVEFGSCGFGWGRVDLFRYSLRLGCVGFYVCPAMVTVRLKTMRAALWEARERLK